ncbi:MAG: HAD family hydrolase, partial [Gemmatimonadetes bacterium]|nr:HAD family hydrolase [Gemmatimonadota bacterium]
EDEEDVHLDEGMQAEENVFSVDYDVWVDQESGEVKIEKYPGELEALKCGTCKFQTLRLVSEEILEAILGHATYTGVSRNSLMSKVLFAVDELCGFLVACALVRPSRSFKDMKVKSANKKLKDKAFARGVNRDEVRQGAEELAVDLSEHIQFIIDALGPDEEILGLGSPSEQQD